MGLEGGGIPVVTPDNRTHPGARQCRLQIRYAESKTPAPMPPIPRHNWITKLTGALRVVVLLPVILLLQPGHPGSWFCGTGTWCGSAADLTCCCGPASQRWESACAEGTGPHLAASHSCDCYYQASPAPAAHPTHLLALNPPDAVPAPVFLLPAPSSVRCGHWAGVRPERPPPPLSGTGTRGPPASRTLLV